MSLSSHDGVCDETKSLAEAPAGRASTWGKARVRWKRETTGDVGRDGRTELLAVAAGCARSHGKEDNTQSPSQAPSWTATRLRSAGASSACLRPRSLLAGRPSCAA
jgi:hypothetical protein